MAEFTSLHRLTGAVPGPLTEQMLADAVERHVAETDDLDWKSKAPAAKGFADSDVLKDIAAMANSGGGLIVCGVTETDRAATGREDIGEITESSLRTFSTVPATAIHPPLYGVRPELLGAPGQRALIFVVPGSDAGPHLIYRNNYFGAPVRNGPDTIWMREPQVAAAYRARFDAQRAGENALTDLYDDALTRGDHTQVAWMYGVARPRVPVSAPVRPTRGDASERIERAQRRASTWMVERSPATPLDRAIGPSLRVGLRRWEIPIKDQGINGRWLEAWAAVHDDGSVVLAAAIGGHQLVEGAQATHAEPTMIEARRCETLVAELGALVQIGIEDGHHVDHDVQIGIEWTGPAAPLTFEVQSVAYTAHADAPGPELSRFRPVRATLRHDVDEIDFRRQVCEVAEDVINQAGLTRLHVLLPEPSPHQGHR